MNRGISSNTWSCEGRAGRVGGYRVTAPEKEEGHRDACVDLLVIVVAHSISGKCHGSEINDGSATRDRNRVQRTRVKTKSRRERKSDEWIIFRRHQRAAQFEV